MHRGQNSKFVIFQKSLIFQKRPKIASRGPESEYLGLFGLVKLGPRPFVARMC